MLKRDYLLKMFFAAGLSLTLLGFSACRIEELPPMTETPPQDFETNPVILDEMRMIEEDTHSIQEDVPYRRMAAKFYLDCQHYDERGFFKAVEQAAPYQVDGKFLAATSPHFLPAMSYTANILSTLAQEGSSECTIFVIAPDHSGEGLPLIVADRGWSTPFGYLDFDKEATAAILKSPYLFDKIDIDLFHLQNDHSAATLMPFIKYYMPDAQVVTILLNGDCNLEQLQALAEIIHDTEQIKPVFVLASIDFSHYLHIIDTAKNDEVTNTLIQASNIQAIKNLDSGYMDSPESMITLINYVTCFPDVKTEWQEHIILAESEMKKDIGYSYSTYIFYSRK